MPSLVAIIEAVIAEAERLERRSSPFPFVNEQNARRIAELHHVATDAQAALDGCQESAQAVADWFGDDFEHAIWMAALALDDVPQITGDCAHAHRAVASGRAATRLAGFATSIPIADEDLARPAHFTLGAIA